MKQYDVIIIGAGAAGLMCATESGKRQRSVLLLDKADKAGKKILISGGGRCNFTNLYTGPDDYLSKNLHFCKSALSRYTQWDFIALLESHALSWNEKTLGQLFCDQKSKAVLDVLLKECKSAGVNIKLNTLVNQVKKQDELFTLQTDKGCYQCKSLVIATGGPSIPAMGASDFALNIAKQFSVDYLPFKAALVPFTFAQNELDQWIRDLSGISTLVELCSESGKCFKESILFTHRGISGPATLQVSSYWKAGESIRINLLPDDNALQWLSEAQQEHPETTLKTILAHKLPKRLAAMLCNIMLPNKPMKQYSAKELDKIAEQLANWRVYPAGTEGLRTAEVCLGGIDTNALSSKTFEVKSVKGLYFIGESIDVTGHLGGFNFQWAWSSGWCAGQYV